ncbi:MAG: LysM peptidoglycan-binding domain-containing protein [Chloroflexi bacterium]|nr:LysM peptidoglycan-binding domain-containing protein [Chloroflexota bacterium]
MTIFAVLFSFQIADAQTENPNSQSPPTPAELIKAVNALRVANGLRPLTEHPVLMQIAQIEVDGIAAGNNGHWRPNNLTLGQWLMSLGYPLSGDLSLDGYRSENWTAGPDLMVQDAILEWTADDPHLNTMLSPFRSHIGAGIATSIDEQGQTIYYYVLETALQTGDGLMQSDAYPTLTAIEMNQVAVYGDATQAAQSLQVSQFIIPVVRATARPDGDVIHEVKNGQSLWSIAIEYGVKIDQIRQLNNLSSTDIYTGDKFLVQKGATQPPTPTANITITPNDRMTLTPQPHGPSQTSTPQPTEEYFAPGQKADKFIFGVIAIASLFLVGFFIATTRKKI